MLFFKASGFEKSLATSSIDPSPEVRITARALVPQGVASAQMGSPRS